MTVKELYDIFCEKYPAHLSCSWDHDGLMVCEDFDAPVTGVVCTLDITDRAIDLAIERGCNVIISHHPMLFDPINYITPEKPISRRVLKLIKHGISIMCFHTRCDAAEGGTNTLMEKALGLQNVEICDPDGIVRFGFLPAPLSAKEFAALVKEAFHVPFVTVADCGKPIQKVAICSGGGGEEDPVYLLLVIGRKFRLGLAAAGNRLP